MHGCWLCHFDPRRGHCVCICSRHPLAGIACAFAGVSGGFSANITPGGLDALLFGITEAAVESSGLGGGWSVNIAGNWRFIAALMVLYIPSFGS